MNTITKIVTRHYQELREPLINFKRIPFPLAFSASLRDQTSSWWKRHLGNQRVDLSYRASFDGGTVHVGNSDLLGGEYTGSSLDLGLHSLGVSMSF